MRIGILGGSFDPVHFGHLLMAECSREDCGLDEVWFMPAAVSPHKRDREPAAATARLEMLELAVAGHAAFRVSSLEIDRGGVSYTVDTLQEVAQHHPDAQLFFLMGADSLSDLPHWRNPISICELAIPVVVERSDAPPPDWQLLAPLVTTQRLREFRRHKIRMPRVEFSSSEIRLRVAAGKSIRYWTPRAVEKYIQASGLYGPAGSSGTSHTQ